MRLPTVFGMCQSVETGLEEKEKEKKQTKEEDPPPGEVSEKEKKGGRSSLGGPEDYESASCT